MRQVTRVHGDWKSILSDPQTRALDGSAALKHHSPQEAALVGWVGGGSTHLLDEVHEAAAEAPGLVPMALQGVHGHLGSPLVAHRHDVDRVVQ